MKSDDIYLEEDDNSSKLKGKIEFNSIEDPLDMDIDINNSIDIKEKIKEPIKTVISVEDTKYTNKRNRGLF